MSCFPFFMDIGGKPALVAGGGTVALRKIEKLLPYGPHLTVVAPVIAEEIAALPGLRILHRPFQAEDLEGMAFVIAATAERKTNRQIASLCHRRGILVNVVDDPAACTFLFPALVKRGELSVGVSTGGASPSAAIYLKEQIETLLPGNLEEILNFLKDIRPTVQAALPEEDQRSQALSLLFRRCLERGRGLTERETEDCLRAVRTAEEKGGTL